MRRQSPPLAQRAAPVSVGRILSMPPADFNGARAGVQMKPIGVPMDQPPLAVGEKPRLVDRRVVAVGLPIVSGSIPGLRPSLRLQSGPTTGPIPQLFSWCVCSCGVVVHSIREESNPLIPSFRGNCQEAHHRLSALWKENFFVGIPQTKIIRQFANQITATQDKYSTTTNCAAANTKVIRRYQSHAS